MMSYARRGGTDRRESAGSLREAGAGVILTLLRWHELARQRRVLLSLDDRMLKDIGLTRADARQEGCRPFWDERGIERARWP